MLESREKRASVGIAVTFVLISIVVGVQVRLLGDFSLFFTRTSS